MSRVKHKTICIHRPRERLLIRHFPDHRDERQWIKLWCSYVRDHTASKKLSGLHELSTMRGDRKRPSFLWRFTEYSTSHEKSVSHCHVAIEAFRWCLQRRMDIEAFKAMAEDTPSNSSVRSDPFQKPYHSTSEFFSAIHGLTGVLLVDRICA